MMVKLSLLFMRGLIVLQIALITLVYVKTLFGYFAQRKGWNGCPYPLDTCLFVTETSIYVNFVELLASTCFSGFGVWFRICLLVVLPLTQVGVLGFCAVSVVLGGIILCQCSSCVRFR
jgi:hypothetical protein